MVKSKENLTGAYAFLVGVILAVILGVLNALNNSPQSENLFYSSLVIIGCIVGFLNIGDRNSATLLFASLSIVLVGNFGREPLTEITQRIDQVNILLVHVIREVMISLQFLFVPVTIIVALKTVFAMTKV